MSGKGAFTASSPPTCTFSHRHHDPTKDRSAPGVDCHCFHYFLLLLKHRYFRCIAGNTTARWLGRSHRFEQWERRPAAHKPHQRIPITPTGIRRRITKRARQCRRGHNYTSTLVIAKTKDENIEWMDEKMPDQHKAVYVANDPKAPLHPPKNKAHEVMVYLSWIIDNYDNLPDVAIFMHAHQLTWHNDDMLNNDAAPYGHALEPPTRLERRICKYAVQLVPWLPRLDASRRNGAK